MSGVPANDENLSLHLVRELEEIGLSEKMVMKMRNAFLLSETLDNIPSQILNTQEKTFLFGSSTEGTTTWGIESDIDTLYCLKNVIVIQDMSEFNRNIARNYMMKTSDASPGYCLLQIVDQDQSGLGFNTTLFEMFNTAMSYTDVADMDGRKFMKNTICTIAPIFQGMEVQGPSLSRQAYTGYKAEDTVMAFPCLSWPKVAQNWLNSPSQSAWPTEQLKRFCASKNCFVVPVASRCSKNPDLEWRISFSLAERHLMFSLNITQIRCYVLMKMILKSYLNANTESLLSSYMCKTVLFHCVTEDPNIWQDHNQIRCLLICFRKLKSFVSKKNCPHFIIPENNLMLHRFSAKSVLELQKRLEYLISNTREIVCSIPIDELGSRLRARLNRIHRPTERSLPGPAVHSECSLLIHMGQSVNDAQKMLLMHVTPSSMFKTLFELLQYCTHKNFFKKIAGFYLATLFCTSTGMTIASACIGSGREVSKEALFWLTAGQNSDVASGRLKLASALYSSGYTEKVIEVLDSSANIYNENPLNIQPMCNCHSYAYKSRVTEIDICEVQLQRVFAYCVRFLPYEINCIPKELRYEMLRSTNEDRSNGSHEYWMDWAVVDSYPFLYFLYYKAFGRLQKRQHQLQVLNDLFFQTAVMDTHNLPHRETSLNLVGQLMVQENKTAAAFQCYLQSLRIRRNNNAANWHICCLLAKLIGKI